MIRLNEAARAPPMKFSSEFQHGRSLEYSRHMDFVRSLFDPSDFPARWHCGNWTPFAGWLLIVSDAVIFLSYMAIPAALAFTLFRRRDLPFPGILSLFVAFIMACGMAHAVDALMFYYPVYRALGVIKAATALISLTTALVLIRSLPAVLAWPSVQAANAELNGAVERELAVRHDLERARTELEARSAILSQRSRRINVALSGLRALACQWVAQTGHIEWEIGYDELATELALPAREFRSWMNLLDERDVARLRDACRQAREHPHESITFEASVAGSSRYLLRLGARAEPEVRGEPPTMVGLLRILPKDHAPG
jgi:hypothetical protein